MHSVITEDDTGHMDMQRNKYEKRKNNTVQTMQHRRKSSKTIAYLMFFYNFVQNFY